MSPSSPDLIDPFTSSHLTYPVTFTTNGIDTFPAPSAYASRKHSWVHIFPEGRVHQHPHLSMRYFRWGVSRLILESEPCPQIIPMFIDGTQQIMHESRRFPRFLPRVGKRVRVCFGPDVDTESVFGDLRRRWRELVVGQEEALRRQGRGAEVGALEMGVLTDALKYTQEAVELRLEVTRRMRNEVLKVRRSLGYVEEDPKAGLVETWRLEGSDDDTAEGKMKDGSWVKNA
jgi:monolysocardiolipin acyltransferase